MVPLGPHRGESDPASHTPSMVLMRSACGEGLWGESPGHGLHARCFLQPGLAEGRSRWHASSRSRAPPGRSLPVPAGSRHCQVFLVLPTEGCKWYPTVLTFAFLIISLCEHLFHTFFFLWFEFLLWIPIYIRLIFLLGSCLFLACFRLLYVYWLLILWWLYEYQKYFKCI